VCIGYQVSLRADTATSNKTWSILLHEDTLHSQQSYKHYQDKYDAAMTATYITIGVYAINLIDAAICGAQSKRKFELYFTGGFGKPLGAKLCYNF
jgi:hypothetical protein